MLIRPQNLTLPSAERYLISLGLLYRMYIKFMDKCCFLGTFVKFVTILYQQEGRSVSPARLVDINHQMTLVFFSQLYRDFHPVCPKVVKIKFWEIVQTIILSKACITLAE